MSTKLMIGVAAGVVLGTAAGWFVGHAGAAAERDRVAEQLATVERERDEVAAEAASVSTELEAAGRRIARLDREALDARKALAAAKQEAAEARASAEAARAPVAADLAEDDVQEQGDGTLGVGQTFSFPDYDEHLATVDWTDVGKHFGAMAPLLAELMDAIAKGEQPSPEAIGGIQRHNGPLVTVAMKLHQKIPGETVNGAFSHPSAVVNAIASTLEALGKPLSRAQLESLGRVGNAFVAEDKRRIEGYGEDALRLRRHAEESLLKGRFYKQALAVLTDEQHTLLRPEATRDRVTVDLFSASLVWVGRARPHPFTDRAELAESLSERLARDLDVAGEPRTRLVATISDWVNGLPDEVVGREPDALWLKGLMPIDAIDRAAQHQLVLMERLLADVDLPEEKVAEIRSHAAVFVPTLRPKN